MRSRGAAALALVIAACAFDLPEPVDADPKTSTTKDAGPKGDASKPGPSGEGGTPTEAGTITPGSCGEGHLLCTDFESDTVEQLFPEVTAPGSAVSASQDHAVSGKTSILVVTPQLTSGQQQEMRHFRVFKLDGKKSKIHLGMSVWIDQRSDSAGGFGVFGSLFISSPPNKLVSTRISFDGSGSTRLNQAVTPQSGAAQFSGEDVDFPSGRWVRVERNLDLDARKVTLVLDNEQPVVLSLPAAFVPTDEVELDFGFEYVTGPAKPYGFYIDDLVFDAN